MDPNVTLRELLQAIRAEDTGRAEELAEALQFPGLVVWIPLHDVVTMIEVKEPEKK